MCPPALFLPIMIASVKIACSPRACNNLGSKVGSQDKLNKCVTELTKIAWSDHIRHLGSKIRQLLHDGFPNALCASSDESLLTL